MVSISYIYRKGHTLLKKKKEKMISLCNNGRVISLRNEFQLNEFQFHRKITPVNKHRCLSQWIFALVFVYFFFAEFQSVIRFFFQSRRVFIIYGRVILEFNMLPTNSISKLSFHLILVYNTCFCHLARYFFDISNIFSKIFRSLQNKLFICFLNKHRIYQILRLSGK